MYPLAAHPSTTLALPCLLCESRDLQPQSHLTSFLFLPSGHEAVRCARCGFVFLTPQPTEQELRQYYDDANYFDRSPLVGGREQIAPHLVQRLSLLEERLHRQGHLLDVGCALGTFVAYAAQQGWEAEGVDVSAWSTEQARKQGLKVATGTLEEQRYPDASFDVVHSSHMLEHVPDPLATLKEMRRILRSDGLLALEVPQEIGCLYETVRTGLHMRPAPESPNPHLSFFTRKTLPLAVERAGFRVIEVQTRNYPLGPGKLFGLSNGLSLLLHGLDTLTKRGPHLVVLAQPAS